MLGGRAQYVRAGRPKCPYPTATDTDAFVTFHECHLHSKAMGQRNIIGVHSCYIATDCRLAALFNAMYNPALLCESTLTRESLSEYSSRMLAELSVDPSSTMMNSKSLNVSV